IACTMMRLSPTPQGVCGASSEGARCVRRLPIGVAYRIGTPELRLARAGRAEHLLAEDCDSRLLLEDQAEEVRPVGVGRARARAQGAPGEPGGPSERRVACDRPQHGGADAARALERGERVDAPQKWCE